GVVVGVGVGVVVGVGVGVVVGVGLAVGDGLGGGLAIGPIYFVAITTLSYHFFRTCVVLVACNVMLARSILRVSIERIKRLGKSPATLPSIQYFTSPLFCPGVLALTISS